MKTINLLVPDNLDVKEAKTLFAAKLYEKGSLTLGQAAELAGFPKKRFIEMLGSFDVSVFAYSETELESDLQNAQNYHLWYKLPYHTG